jgi:Zn-finger nucleic acid-binding protein
MTEKIEAFYCKLKDFYGRISGIRSKTVSTHDFKKEATEILPTLRKLKIKDDVYSRLDELFEAMNSMARERVTNVSWVKENLSDTKDKFFKEVILSVRKIESPEPTEDLMDSASFLGLDTNWSVAVCALQLQEVAITLVAEKTGISLDRKDVEKILKTQIQSKDFSFNHQYEAFGNEVKRMFDVDMPILVPQLRRMRVNVLHEGYNPEPEEKDSLVSFTIGLLKKLNSISSAEKS